MNKKYFIVLSIGLFTLMLAFFIGNIIELGQNIGKVSDILAYTFYLFCILFFAYVILFPVWKIMQTQEIKPELLRGEERGNHKIFQKAAKKLAESDQFTEEEREILLSKARRGASLQETFIALFDAKEQQIDTHIRHAAKQVLLLTALAPYGRLDSLIVLVYNFKMIHQLVEVTGFRPSYYKLLKLYINVLGTAFAASYMEDIAEGIGDSLEDLIPFAGNKVVSMGVGGFANAMLCARIGYITKQYLYHPSETTDEKMLNKLAQQYAKKEAYPIFKEMLPNKLVYN